ncbi:MAG: DNA repair protein RecO [Alphaproteobacteria bacterium]
MDWSDRGIVLSARKHGESAAIVSLLTHAHGRHGGLVRGGAGRRARGLYQPGNLLTANWRARLPEHLGGYSCELERAWAADFLDDPPRLAGLAAVCALVDAALPEREPHPRLFDALSALIEARDAPGWAAIQVHWELTLLADLGFGLELGVCAATGTTDDLAYVSPRSGRAVSRAAGRPYRDKLLVLPAFLMEAPVASVAPPIEDIFAGLRLTGYFLERFVFAPLERRLPPARTRYIECLKRIATKSGKTEAR